MALERIDRPPRIQPELPIGEHPIPAPPEAPRDSSGVLMNALLPLISMVGFLFVSSTGNVLTIIPMGLIMVVSVGASLYNVIRERRTLEAKRKAYREMLLTMRNDMTRAHNAQRLHYLHNFPDAPTLLEVAGRKETSRFGSRLWERRPGDRDFGAVRLGMGSRPSTVVYKFEQGGDPINETDLHKDARKLAEDSRVVTDVPVTIPLRRVAGESSGEQGDPLHGAIPARHSVGIVGAGAAQTADFVRAMTAHFAAFHSPQDTRLYVIGHPQRAADWEWAQWLPHVAPQEDELTPDKDRDYDQLCFSTELADTQAFWGRIKRELDQRQVRLREAKDEEAQKAVGDVSLPFLLIAVDMLGPMPDDSPLRDVASEATVALIHSLGPTLGAAIVFVAGDAGRIPSECVGLVEVQPIGDQVVFRYAEIGTNTTRYIGEADLMSAADARQNFAARIRRLELIRPFGADLPRAIDLLQMNSLVEGKRLDTVDKLPVPANWQRSVVPKNQEWLSAPIGMVSGKEVRNLVFSAREGGDGVHGMIAGTTGSGKSELLMTLIAELAMKYDPRVLNFVLVDFKGGSTIEPFRYLPHTVDLLTNLQANAIERMFVAIQAVMEQRSALLAQANAKDLVEYRKKVVPNLPPDSPLPRTFPHLFIIVDEFAEMITQNPDYKAQFESVTRLGRAFGVSLLLATQRPAGVVTDQMRANMKFRICLRVETPDDSKELLGRGDAAFLPNLGGRGYIQVGNDVITPIQVAWAGKPYSDERKVVLKDVVWLDEEEMPKAGATGDAPLYSATELGEALHMKPGDKPGTVLDWVVGITALRAARDGVPKQTKPWPDPLPAHLSLTRPVDARYLNTDRPLADDKTLVISPDLQAWLDNADAKPIWPEADVKRPRPLRADVGLLDDPYHAEQRLLTIDLADGPVVMFGGAGRGKSVFLKTLLTGLATSRTPRDLNMYLLDFGSDGLKDLRDLPHVGAVIKPSDTARVDQMVRMLRNFVKEREERLANYSGLADYNAKNPTRILADLVFVIDNFVEFRENYEHLIPELMSLVRDGRAFGLNFVIAANTPADLTGKFYNLFSQRLTLTQSDPTIYGDVVGSGVRNFDNVPGRGVARVQVKEQSHALEFHIGMPGLHDDEIEDYREISQRMLRAWTSIGGKRPAAELPRSVTLLEMFARLDGLMPGNEYGQLADLRITERWADSMKPENQAWLRAPIGLVSSTDVRSLVFQAQADGVHGMAAGTTGSGKSELLQTLIAGMCIKYDPRIVNFVLVDYKGGPTVEPFRKLPHCVDIATNLEGNKVDRIFTAINAEMLRRSNILAKAGAADLVEYRKKVAPNLPPDSPLPRSFPHLFIIVDEFAEMVTRNPEFKAQFESITRLGRSFGVSLLLATQRPTGAVTDQMQANMKYRLCLRVETPEDSKELLKRPDAARLPQIAGRGYLQAGSELLTEVQAAWSGAPYAGDKAESPYAAESVLDAMQHAHTIIPATNDPANAQLYDPSRRPDAPRSMLGWLVGALAAEAQRQGVPKQFKPWPDPLPELLPINGTVDASYISDLGGVDGTTTVLHPALATWAGAGGPAGADGPAGAGGPAGAWRPTDWSRPLSLRAAVGVIDDPFQSNQHLLSFEVAGDPIGVFGASGRGKTTFVKSLLFALAADKSPADLNIYCLDFGRGALRAVRELPHCGATIDASQADRVEALFRMIRGIMNERAEKLDKSKEPSIESWNARQKDNPDQVFPSIVLVIDNFAEFKENYDGLLPELLSLVRDGRRFGIFFIITASQFGDIPNKLFNLLGQRVAFSLSDAGAYPDIVGKGFLPLADVPGRGLINYKGQPLEFHVAVPVMEGEADAFMRIAERMEKARAANGLKRPSADIPKAVTLLEMQQQVLGRRIDRLGDLDIAGQWRESLKPENQEWLQAAVGFISSKEVRRMIFSAKAGGDGVHGLAAGTTGSGKSELLQTLIASLAIRYDPRIVNFVLVDYKGGPTVEPFRKLPHCVDIATNLEGNKVERIFAAINAEMNRRSSILARAGVADLVEYRKKVAPSLKPGSPFPATFPHLFIIVDEFAEMIQNNPDFKAQFESITRLGRSFGVSLLLAAQRPAGGVVSDQMRSNMKYRICLRVETSDDSKELLGRPDAATLPAIGGRGYIQVGGGPLSEVQAAWSGAPYDETKPDAAFKVEDVLDALGKRDDPPRSLLGWLVGALALEARRQKVPEQWKPWPDPLPDVLPINQPFDADYIKAKPQNAETIVISPDVGRWIEDANAGWAGAASGDGRGAGDARLETMLGIVDNPYLAEQRVLNLNLSGDPLAVFGAAGRGKTMFLKSLVLALAARFAPHELHVYALDFGRGGLRALRKLPHIGGIVEGNEEERIERFFRLIRNLIDERQAKLQAYDSFEDYNTKNPDSPFPKVLVVIDNAVEFKEAQEKYQADLISLLRDGRSFGISFVVSGALYSDIPMRMFNLLTQRLTFTQADPTDYAQIFGRRTMRINDTPGRGLAVEMIGEEPVPLEFQAAVPMDPRVFERLHDEEVKRRGEGETVDDKTRAALMRRASDETQRALVERMAKAWEALAAARPELRHKRAQVVEPLSTAIDLAALLPPPRSGKKPVSVPLGVNDLDRQPTLVEIGAKGPHWSVTGPPVSGKTTVMRSLVLALAQQYSPDDLAMVFIDPSDASRQFFNFGAAGATLDALPHVLGTVSDGKAFDAMVMRLRAEYDEDWIAALRGQAAGFEPADNARRSIVVMIDHYEDMDGLLRGSKYGAQGLAEIGKGKNLHLVISGSTNAFSGSPDDLRRRVESSRYSLVLQDAERVRYQGVRLSQMPAKELPTGRGYLIKSVSAALAQFALPSVEGRGGRSADDELADLLRGITGGAAGRARWSYSGDDLAPLEALMAGKEVEPAAGGGATAVKLAGTSEANDMLAELAKLTGGTGDLLKGMAVAMPTAMNFASLEVEVPDQPKDGAGAAKPAA